MVEKKKEINTREKESHKDKYMDYYRTRRKSGVGQVFLHKLKTLFGLILSRLTLPVDCLLTYVVCGDCDLSHEAGRDSEAAF